MAKNVDISEYLTVKEFATLAKVSPQSIYKKIRQQSSLSQYIKTVNGVKMIHKSALSQVYGVKFDDDDTAAQPVDNQNNQTEQLISLLREQLAAKDKQIADLTEALKAEQILRASADQRLALLEDRSQRRQQDTETVSQPSEEPPADDTVSPDPNRQQSFLKRIRVFLGL